MKTNNKIKIKINGKNISVEEDLKVSGLVKKLDISLNKVAIELNNKIIDKKKLKNITLKNKDKLEIVHFIGGG
jgi:thiamine biosynthesis protein ThiS